MSRCIEKISHTCGSMDGLQVFEKEDGSYDGYCFSCGTFVPDPYESRPKGYKPDVKIKSKAEIQEEIKEIRTYQTIDLPDRQLNKDSLSYFGIKVGVSEQDGSTPVSHYYPYTKDNKLSAYKVRIIEGKKMFSKGDMKDVDLFGWAKAKRTGAKKLFITEGELDAVALHQIIKSNSKEAYKDTEHAIVSLPTGAGNADKVLGRVASDINRLFKEVVFVFDMDEAGKDAANKASVVIKNATVATLPEKDVNDCLIKGRSKACFAAVMFNSSKPKNTRLVRGRDLHEAAREQAPWGVSWPWDKLTDLTRGIRKGETIYFGAAQKMGKSEIVNAVAGHLIKEHNWSVLLAKPEESNKKSYKMLAGKVVGKVFHDPKVPFDYEAYDKAGKVLDDKLFMLNLYQHLGWETLKEDIIAAASEGVDAVFIDPITNLTNGISAAEANVKLQEIAQEVAAMALDLNIVVFLFCHLRNPDGGLPHDRGGKVLTSQFAGSRAMGRSSNYMLGLEGNKDPELSDEERNMRKLILLDDREYGEVGEVPLYWDKNTTLFNEVR
jgi:twinkle protein